jgi:hypothetical protein
MDENTRRKAALAAVLILLLFIQVAESSACLQQIALEQSELKRRKRARYAIERDEMQTMANLFGVVQEAPTEGLVTIGLLGRVLHDPGRNYLRVFTKFYIWEFVALANHLQGLIQRPRRTRHRQNVPSGDRRRPCKFDHFHRLYLTLSWLAEGREFKKMEFDCGRPSPVLPRIFLMS